MKSWFVPVIGLLLASCHPSSSAAVASAPAASTSAASPQGAALTQTPANPGHARAMFETIGRIENKPVLDVEKWVPASDVISIPDPVGIEDLRELTEAYLKVQGLILLKRDNQLIVKDLKEYFALWGHDVTAAQKKAEAEGKPLLIKLEAAWCGPCHDQDRAFYREEILFKELAKFVIVKLDVTTITDGSIAGRERTAEERAGIAFLDQHKLNGRLSLPTLVIINAKKRETVINSYYRNPERVRTDLEAALL